MLDDYVYSYPNVQGEIALELTINADGTVKNIDVVSSSLKDAKVQQCIIERLKWQKTFAGWQQVSQGGNTNEEAIEKRQELSSVIAETFKSGQAIVNARIHFVLKAETEEAVDAATNTLINVLNRLGADGLKEDKIGDTLFLTCLPLNFDYTYEKFIRRTKRLLSDNLSDMVPLYGSFRGTKTPATLYVNRRGEPVCIDFFDSDINPHGLLIGSSLLTSIIFFCIWISLFVIFIIFSICAENPSSGETRHEGLSTSLFDSLTSVTLSPNIFLKTFLRQFSGAKCSMLFFLRLVLEVNFLKTRY